MVQIFEFNNSGMIVIDCPPIATLPDPPVPPEPPVAPVVPDPPVKPPPETQRHLPQYGSENLILTTLSLINSTISGVINLSLLSTHVTDTTEVPRP